MSKTQGGKGTNGTNGTNGAEKKVRKNTKGVPRVTDKVIAMDEAGRAKWLAEKTVGLSAETVKEITARLADAVANGRKPKSVNFGTLFNGRTIEELTEAQTALTSALAIAAETAEKEAQEQLARITAKIAAMKAAKTAVAAAAPTAPVTA